MNIVSIGGGPAGLYAALLLKRQRPDDRIVVVERYRPYDTRGSTCARAAMASAASAASAC
jgi:2-polyprenyl-6-methoxyphenol hydroxylase-like FAD-dependent oxidoreductase